MKPSLEQAPLQSVGEQVFLAMHQAQAEQEQLVCSKDLGSKEGRLGC